VNLDHLRVLVAVLESGTFTAAAARLKLSQPAVSQHMAALEREAGLQLFERAGRLRVPTDAARELADRGRVAMAALAEADRTAEELRGLRGGRLSVGTTESPGVYRVPGMLGEFAKRYPDVELRMDIADGSELIRRLRIRDLDVGILCEATPAEGIVTATLPPERLIAVWSPDSPMATGKSGLDRFMEQPFIARQPGSGIRKAVDRWALEQGYDVQPAMELASLEAMKQAVMNGLGVSVLPEAGVRAETADGRLRVGRLPGTPLKARVDLAILEGRRPSGPLESFIRGALGSRAGAMIDASAV
jgi:DNA-binding transcriptional LysR family regulator